MLEKIRSRWAIDALALAFIALVFWFLAGKLVVVRTPANGDQSGYLELAANLHDGEGFITKSLSPFYPTQAITRPESIRQPMLPLLLSLTASRDLSCFLRARWWVWSLSLLCLILFYASVAQTWSRPVAFFATALLGLNVHFHMYASEIWCENLLILWTTTAGIGVYRYFQSERWRPALRLLIAAGAAAALGYYTKASAAVLAIAFGVVCGLRLLRDLRQKQSSVRIYGRSIAPLFHFALTFAFLLLPYVILNLVNTGTLLRNRDLQANLWVAERGEYYLPYDTPPSASKLFQEEPPVYFLRRLGLGLYYQAGNHLDAVRIAPDTLKVLSIPLPGGIAVPLPSLAIFAFALVHLLRSAPPPWKKFLLILLGFNAVMAAWYIVIDVAPRFIYVGVPFLYIHAALGFQQLLKWIAGRAKQPGALPARAGGLLLVLPVLLLGLTLVENRSLLKARPGPLLQSELDVIYFLKDRTPPDTVLLLGPSHQLPYNYLFDRRNIFVPKFTDWNRLLEYTDHFGARYFLLDQEIYHRRLDLFSPYIDWDMIRGLALRQPLPRMQPLYISSDMPCNFIIFQILPPA